MALVIFSGCSTAAMRASARKASERTEARAGLFRAFAQGSAAGSARANDIADWKPPLDQMQVTSPFGKRRQEFHEGIDLRAENGTPVYAVDSGVVAYAGNKIRGYGRMVVLVHDRYGLTTVYAHHSKILVKNGQKVNRGQLIARSGSSGQVTGPHLHFEVRKGSSPIDPLPLLKKTRPRFAQVGAP